jgi:hypothetical protein
MEKVEQLENEIMTSFNGLVLLNAYGERSFFYNPHKNTSKRNILCHHKREGRTE